MIDRALQAGQRLYKAVASIDPMAILPMITPLAQDLIRTIPTALFHGRALDVGTGLGIVAKQLAQHPLSVVGLDLSEAMLRVAARLNDPRNPVHYVCADLLQPPLASASFDLIVASFGLNLTAPHQSLRQLRRLLKPGGGLIIQEWATEDALSSDFDRTFMTHMNQNASVDQQLTGFIDLPDTWSEQMQDLDDYRDQLEAAGFETNVVNEGTPKAVAIESDAFIAYRLAWPTYRYQWNGLDKASQEALYQDLTTTIMRHATAAGELLWRPPLFRIVATIPKTIT